MTTQELIQYYSSLLILQYLGKPRAVATIETSVTGPIMDQLPTQIENGFVIGSTTISGVTYPGAIGVQLDILGKYVGVTRSGVDLSGNHITLNDTDFTTLIKLAAITNSAGSSLATIVQLLHMFFPNEIFVHDTTLMELNYLIASSVGDQALIELFVTEGLLPKPMGVALAEVTYIPSISLFGFQSYDSVAPTYDGLTNYGFGARVQAADSGIVYTSLIANNFANPVTDTAAWLAIIYPMNTYDTYPVYKPYKWLSYDDGIPIG